MLKNISLCELQFSHISNILFSCKIILLGSQYYYIYYVLHKLFSAYQCHKKNNHRLLALFLDQSVTCGMLVTKKVEHLPFYVLHNLKVCNRNYKQFFDSNRGSTYGGSHSFFLIGGKIFLQRNILGIHGIIPIHFLNDKYQSRNH